MFYQSRERGTGQQLQSNYDLVDSVLQSQEGESLRRAESTHGLLFISTKLSSLLVDDVTGKLGAYTVMEGMMHEVYRSAEQVLTFDFDSENMYLAVGTARAAVVYMAMQHVINSGVCEMKAEYTFQTKSQVVKVEFVRTGDSTLYLVVGTLSANEKSCSREGRGAARAECEGKIQDRLRGLVAQV